MLDVSMYSFMSRMLVMCLDSSDMNILPFNQVTGNAQTNYVTSEVAQNLGVIPLLQITLMNTHSQCVNLRQYLYIFDKTLFVSSLPSNIQGFQQLIHRWLCVIENERR